LRGDKNKKKGELRNGAETLHGPVSNPLDPPNPKTKGSDASVG